MSRKRRINETGVVNPASLTGTTHQIFANLAADGFPSEAWALVLNSQTQGRMFREQLAAEARRLLGQAEVPDITKLLSDARLADNCVNEYIRLPEHNDRWTNKGGRDRVRGEFYALNMGKNYTENDIDDELDRATRMAKRTDGKRLRRATAYEGAAFAALGTQNGKTERDKSDERGWNGRDYVLVAGSSVRGPDGNRYLAALWFGDGQRRFNLLWDDNTWHASSLVLCVWE
jgi:hypothetical protein